MMTQIATFIRGARSAQRIDLLIDALSKWLGVLDWDSLDDDLASAFWDDGGVLPGDTPLSKAVYALSHARHVFVFLGSGFSVDSGIASFRVEDHENPSIYQGLQPYHMTHADTFEVAAGAQLAWHQSWRRVMQAAMPHEGQRALVRIARMTQGEYTFVTQNVDDLLERAARQVGEETYRVWHLHGSLEHVRCHECGERWGGHPIPDYEALPECEACGGPLRPDVVWFGEELPAEAMEAARAAAQRAEVCMIIGTSALVHPAAELPMIAKQSGARLIEVNTRHSMLTEHCDVHLEGTTRDVLMALEAALRASKKSGGGAA